MYFIEPKVNYFLLFHFPFSCQFLTHMTLISTQADFLPFASPLIQQSKVMLQCVSALIAENQRIPCGVLSTKSGLGVLGLPQRQGKGRWFDYKSG